MRNGIVSSHHLGNIEAAQADGSCQMMALRSMTDKVINVAAWHVLVGDEFDRPTSLFTTFEAHCGQLR